MTTGTIHLVAGGIMFAIVVSFTAKVAISRADETGVVESAVPPPVSEISGTVVTPDGKPAAGAAVVVLSVAWRAEYYVDPSDEKTEVIARTMCDERGRFRLTDFKPSKYPWQLCQLLVSAKGFALTWREIELAEQRMTDIKMTLQLGCQQHGQVLLPDKKPAANVSVQLSQMLEIANPDSLLSFHNLELPSDIYPTMLKTDAQGQFTIGQLPPHYAVSFSIDREPYLHQDIFWNADNNVVSHDITLSTGQTITGVAVAADTGQPLAHLGIYARGGRHNGVLVGWMARGKSDDKGIFRLNVPQGDAFEIHTDSPLNTPYFGGLLQVTSETDLSQHLRVELPRGVAVHGRVIEQPSGKPAAGVAVGFHTRDDNPNLKEVFKSLIKSPTAVTDDQGWFTLGVPEGRATLLVFAASADDVAYRLSESELKTGKPGIDAHSIYAFGHLPIDVPAGVRKFDVQIPIRRGVTVEGKSLGADGSVPATVKMTYRGRFANFVDAFHNYNVWPLYDGHLKIRGVPPDGELLVFLLDPIGKQGKLLHVHGSDAGQPLNVTLEKCGSATVRFVDPQGKPVAGLAWTDALSLLYLPEDTFAGSTSEAEVLNRDGIYQRYYDFLNCRDLMSDENGKMTISALIPGAIYQFNQNLSGLPREIKVQPGENLELPDAVINDPRALQKAAAAWKEKQQQTSAQQTIERKDVGSGNPQQ